MHVAAHSPLSYRAAFCPQAPEQPEPGSKEQALMDALFTRAQTGVWSGEDVEAALGKGMSIPRADALLYQATGRTHLMLAAAQGNAGVVRALAPVSALNKGDKECGLAALHWACERGHPEVVRALLEAGADIDRRDGAGYSPLLSAAEWGRLEIVQLLLAAGADPTLLTNDGLDAIFCATVVGEEPGHPRSQNKGAIIKLLVAAGLDPQQPHPIQGWRAIHCAAQFGNLEAIAALAEVDVHLDAGTIKEGWTALVSAAINHVLVLLTSGKF